MFYENWLSVASSLKTTAANFTSLQTHFPDAPLCPCCCLCFHCQQEVTIPGSSNLESSELSPDQCFLFSKLKRNEQDPVHLGILSWEMQE
jgi:hypothetical protein